MGVTRFGREKSRYQRNTRRGHVGGELIRQFRLTHRPKVLPQLRPRSQAGTLDDPLEPGPQVHRRVAISRDAILGTLFGLLRMTVRFRAELFALGRLRATGQELLSPPPPRHQHAEGT